MGESDAAGASPASGGGEDRKRVLVVDDERHIVRLVQINLERQGLEVITASDGREAMERIREQTPDLIILDVMMPHMDGFEVLAQLKADSALTNIPVIMLTARAQDRDVLRGMESGADLYLTKPFNPFELVNFVKRFLA